MRAIVAAFKEKNTIDDNAVYLFFGTTSTNGLEGVMNRGGQFGFIFDSSVKTIAHELGHGLFALEHTSNDNSNGLAVSDLMESGSTGTLLYKYQWQYVQNPPAVWSIVESAEDAELANIIVQYGVNVAINLGVQMVFARMFDDEATDWAKAWEKTSLIQALSDGVVDMISAKKWRLMLGWGSNFVQCLSRKEDIGAPQLAECGLMGLVDIIAGEAIHKYGKTAVEKGLKKFGYAAQKISTLLGEVSSTPPKTKPRLDKTTPQTAEQKAVIEKLTKKVQAAGGDLAAFVNKTLTQKFDDIKGIWNTKYPVQEMLEGRSFFEDIMGHYRYAKGSGWSHTGDISEFFKGVDFYKGTTQGANIFAETAVSMKTTIATNVDTWLASTPIQKNIVFLTDGLNPAKGLQSNSKLMFIQNAEIHIYMPKANITDALKTTWMNKLNTVNPKIKFEIKALEDFVN